MCCFEMQIQLLLNKDEPVFSNIVDHANGMVSVANYSLNKETKKPPKLDLYQPVYDADRLHALLARAVQEYNKTEPVLKVALYRVRSVVMRQLQAFVLSQLIRLCVSP
jgi:hypothetical protein